MINEHCNNISLTNVNYFSQLGANLCFNPLLKEYFQQAHIFCLCSPAPAEMTIAPEFQPYFRGPHINSPKSQPLPQGLAMHANVPTIPATTSLQLLENCSLSFECFPQ
jgi:hypothetical protein